MPLIALRPAITGLALLQLLCSTECAKPYDVKPPDGSQHMNFNASVDQIIRRVMAENEKQGLSETDPFPGYILAEFDMLLKPEQAEQLYSPSQTHSRSKRKAYKSARPWKNGIVNFLIDPWEFNGQERAVLHLSMAEWSQKTCIKFKPATAADADKIMFQNGIGCNSQLGMVGGEQALNLQAPGCRFRGLYLHEIGHALGLVHEHQLPERDDFIEIIFDNVKPEWRQWFDKYKTSEIQNYGIEYNLRSVMHYGITAFSKDDRSQTIRAKARSGQSIEDVHLNELSFSDIKAINLFYNCSAQCPAGIRCDGGGFVSKECKCYCPDGTSNCQAQPKIPVMQKPTCSNEAKDADCETWARAKECAYNPLYMHSKCRRSCNKCEPLPTSVLPPKECDNSAGDEDCEAYARTGECYTSAAWMYLNCTAACGMCLLKASKPDCVDLYPDESQCKLWREQGLCDRKPSWMWANCRKTCGVCGQKPEGCSNALPDDICYARATTGECENSPTFMLEQCSKACGKCGNCFNEFPDDGVCVDLASKGECAQSWEWMGSKCKKACKLCDGWEAGKPRPCMDLNDDCAKWAEQGECQSNPSWMISNCQKSCGRCECANKHRDGKMCEQWASQGECVNNPAWMVDNCQKSCGACTNAVPSADRCVNAYDSAKCDGWARQGECAVNPRFMIPNCRKSCTRCNDKGPLEATTTTTPGACVNKYNNNDCDSWARSGECQANPSWMQVQCARSCNKCGTECKNIHSSDADCTKWAAAGECERNPKWMAPNCMKACGGCSTSGSTSVSTSRASSIASSSRPTAVPTTVPTTTKSTACVTSPSSTTTQPRTTTAATTTASSPFTLRSTTATTPVTTASCRNVYQDVQCRDWKTSQQCTRNPTWMFKYCYKECSGCGGPEPVTTPTQSTQRPTTTARLTTPVTSSTPTSTARTVVTSSRPVTSTITTTRTVPTSPVTTTLLPVTTAQPPDCMNTYNEKSCLGWAKAGHCTSNPGWMLKYCYKACSGCSDGAEEGAVNWASWGSFGPCSRSCGGGNRIRMRLCPRPGECLGKGGVIDTESESCNTQACFVTTTLSPNVPPCSNEYGDDRACETWAAAGQCEKNPLWMGAYCAKSCHNCLKACKDVLEYDCPVWAAANECRNNPWMRHNCYKSCTSCATVKALTAAKRNPDGTVVIEEDVEQPLVADHQSLVPESLACQNIYSDRTCDRLAAAKACNTSVGGMKFFCQKACGCPEPEATWGSWSRWSSCSRTCYTTTGGSGLRLRTRTCSDSRKTCSGPGYAIEPCKQTVVCRGS